MQSPGTETHELRRRQGCDERCLRRIAVHLCRLDSHGSSNKTLWSTSKTDSIDDGITACSAKTTGCCLDAQAKIKIDNCSSKDATNAEKDDCCSKQTNEANCHSEVEQSSPKCCSTNVSMKINCCNPEVSKEKVECNDTLNCGSPGEVIGAPCCTGSLDSPLEQICEEACCKSKSEVSQRSACNNGRCTPTDSCGMVENQTASASAPPKVPSCSNQCCANNPEVITDSLSCGSGGCSDCQDGTITIDNISSKSNCSGECCGGGDPKSDEDSGSNDKCMDECCKIIVGGMEESSIAACSEHLVAAFERFESLLLLGKCLCRSVLDQLGFCCCTLTSDGLMTAAPICSTHIGVPSNMKRAEETQRSKPALSEVDEIDVHSRCSQDIQPRKKAPTTVIAPINSEDIEQAASREHVVLSVSGMTCTGCSKKMKNVLDHIPGISNAKVTFVSEVAEFDLNNDIALRDGILSQIEKETGFTCFRVISGYQHLDVLLPGIDPLSFEAGLPDGVIDFAKTDKKTYRITYNPRIVGARSILPPGTVLAPPRTDFSVEEGKRRLRNTLASFIMSLALTIPILALNWSDNRVPHVTRSIVSLILATFVQAIGVPEFYVPAIKSLVYSRVLEMDMLVVISITCAYTYSCVAFGLTAAGIHLEQEAFFETSTLLVTLVLLGRLISAFARVRAVSAVSLRSLQAETALLVHENGEVSKVDARLLQYGDTVKVPSHSRIVTDGKVTAGESAIDESMVTGESVPVRKKAGDSVIAGTLNTSGSLTVQLTRLPGENSITDIANLVEQAIGAKPRVQDLADRIASYFIPSIVGIAIVVFAIWVAIALEVRKQNGGGAVGTAITYAIAVLAVSCPCALGLAVPMVLVIAGGVAARSGVIIKAASAIETSSKITDVVFDKTGTLTKGDLQVVYEEFCSTSVTKRDIIAVTRALVESNDHPVSVAIHQHLSAHHSQPCSLSQVQSIPGAGIQAVWNGSIIKAGNPYWLGFDNQPKIIQLLEKGITYFCLALDDKLLQVYGLQSTLRQESQPVVRELQNQKIICHIVSGDAPKVVNDVALALGIESCNTAARRTPAQKQEYVHDLQAAGRKVLFCGDGTNDAVAIAQADVGVQIGSASDITGAVADVVLLGGLDGVINLHNISTRAFRRIRFNFAWTAIYNILAILLAAGAFVRFRIQPAYAGLGEIVSIAPVILAAISLAFSRRSLVRLIEKPS